ncbi:MAG: hypothetical protein CVU41_15035 [Chloroflexi bacterium HGW-Chloroflexi-3]|nr:MAG: hypothetical protein CVU41_15035 [Chloroflexi bacterium HGW-Chloroflexi-3]
MAIRAVIFDLDGTLVQTERLKAYSYTKAIRELSAYTIEEAIVINAFKDVVGLSRREVAQGLLERFHLEEAARSRMEEFGVETPWQAFVQIRLQFYEQLLSDPQMILKNTWSHNILLLEEVKKAGCRIGLATMSYCPQVNRVLEILNLKDYFDFIASRDDVEHGKPDPEIYQMVACELDVPAEECLVIEDSPTGVKAALAAGMKVIAVTTPFTKTAFSKNKLVDDRWIVNDPERLPQIVKDLMREN